MRAFRIIHERQKHLANPANFLHPYPTSVVDFRGNPLRTGVSERITRDCDKDHRPQNAKSGYWPHPHGDQVAFLVGSGGSDSEMLGAEAPFLSAFEVSEEAQVAIHQLSACIHKGNGLMIRNLLSRLLHMIAFVGPGGGSLRPWMHRLRGVHVGRNVWFSHFVYIDDCHPSSVSIGDNSTIGLRTTIFAHLYFGPARSQTRGAVVIERDVFIGPHCVILPNVRIGEGAVIKAGTVVSRNVPPHTLWGPPAPEILADATVPLTAEHSYEEFVQGMRLHARAERRTHEVVH